MKLSGGPKKKPCHEQDAEQSDASVRAGDMIPLMAEHNTSSSPCARPLRCLQAEPGARPGASLSSQAALSYPKCAASIPSAATKIPCACSWRTGRLLQPLAQRPLAHTAPQADDVPRARAG
jgi:hypothetical protein